MPAPDSIGNHIYFEGDRFIWQESLGEWIFGADPFDFTRGRELTLTFNDPPQSDEMGDFQDAHGVSAVDVSTYDVGGVVTDHKFFQIVAFNDIRQWVRSDETADYNTDPQYVYGPNYQPYTLTALRSFHGSAGHPGNGFSGRNGFLAKFGFRSENGFSPKNGFKWI